MLWENVSWSSYSTPPLKPSSPSLHPLSFPSTSFMPSSWPAGRVTGHAAGGGRRRGWAKKYPAESTPLPSLPLHFCALLHLSPVPALHYRTLCPLFSLSSVTLLFSLSSLLYALFFIPTPPTPMSSIHVLGPDFPFPEPSTILTTLHQRSNNQRL